MSQNFKTWELGPKWPLLDLNTDPAAGLFATDAVGVRVDRARLEGIEPPALIGSASLFPLRAIHYHVSAVNGTVHTLVWADDAFRVDGIQAKTEAGVTYATTPVGRPVQLDEGHQTTWIDASGDVYWWDDRPAFSTSVPPVVHKLELPVAPGAATASVADIVSKAVDALVAASRLDDAGGVKGLERMLGFYMVSGGALGSGHFDSAQWTADGFGVNTPRLNTDVTVVQGDGWYKLVLPPWTATRIVRTGDRCLPTVANGHMYEAQGAGTTHGTTEPTWPTTAGATVTDNGITWKEIGATAYLDWRTVTALTFQVYPDASGQYLAFVFGTSAPDPTAAAWGGQIIPFAIKSAGATNTITVNLPNIPDSLKNGIKWWGFQYVSATDSVFNVKGLEYQTGTVGVRDYAFTLRRRIPMGTDETILRGPENVALTDVNAGTKGAKVTLTLPAIPTGSELEIWRRDQDAAARYHFLTYVASGTATYDDAQADVSLGVLLEEARCAAPTNATALCPHAGRLMIFEPGTAWLSAQGDFTQYRDLTPEQWLDLQAAGTTFTLATPMRLPLGDAGTVLCALRHGLQGADTMQTATLAMTATGQDVLVTGSTPDDIAIVQRRAGGVCGPYAATVTPDGYIARVTPDAEVQHVSPGYQAAPVSVALGTTLTEISGRATWQLIYDRQTARMILITPSSAFVWDSKGKGILVLDYDSLRSPTAAAEAPDADGGHAVIGCIAGDMYRLFNPTGTPSVWRWESSDLSDLPARHKVTRVKIDKTGAVTTTIIVDGTPLNSTTGDEMRILYAPAVRRIRLRLEGTGSVQNVQIEAAKRWPI